MRCIVYAWVDNWKKLFTNIWMCGLVARFVAVMTNTLEAPAKLLGNEYTTTSGQCSKCIANTVIVTLQLTRCAILALAWLKKYGHSLTTYIHAHQPGGINPRKLHPLRLYCTQKYTRSRNKHCASLRGAPASILVIVYHSCTVLCVVTWLYVLQTRETVNCNEHEY